MKLHLLIDSKIQPKVDNDDIILISRYNHSLQTSRKIRLIDVTIADEEESVGVEMRKLYSELDVAFQKTLNTAYVKFFLPIEVVLMNIKKVLNEEDVSEIVLYEGSEEPCFRSEGAEGEGERGNYKTNYLVNAFVKKQYEEKLKINWVGKQSKWATRISCYWHNTRSNCRLMLARIIKRIREKNTIIDKSLTDVQAVSIINLLLQKKHLDTIYETSNISHIYLSYNRSLVDNMSVFPVLELPLKHLLGNVEETFSKSVGAQSLTYKGVKTKTLVRELRYCLLKYAIYYQRLSYTMAQLRVVPLKLMVSNTTVGDDMVSIHNVAKAFGMRHVNLQYVSMSRVLYPNLELADEYYLYAKRTYELYKRYSDIYHYYLPIQNVKHQKDVEGKIRLTVFTQPDSYGIDYVEYLDVICPEITNNGMGVEVLIRPHYRQDNIKDFEQICSRFNFVSMAKPGDSIPQILKKTDIAMSINSSVIFEAMMSGIPSIVYNPSDKYHVSIYNNDVCYPEVNFVIEDAIRTLEILENYSKYSNDFQNRLALFIKTSSANTSISEIIGE